MHDRSELQSKLESMLGSKHVYYQPPDQVKMEYPAIRYSKKSPDIRYAGNKKYLKFNCYEIIVISKKPDEPVIGMIEDLPMCEWNNHYVSDNLNHDVLTIFY